MEANYYAPEITDFHDQFNYEIWNGIDSWYKAVFKIDGMNDGLKTYLSKKLIRVKCLDKEDIESLGWDFIKLHPGTTTYDFELGNYFITFDPDFGPYWNIRIYDGEDQDSEFNYFNGFIKNKTEFKRIVHQIGLSGKRQLERL